MVFFWIKVILSALIIAGVSEVAKRSSVMAAILASLPLVSILSLLWFYIETRNRLETIALSQSIFWAVLPSLLFFVVFPLLLKWNLNFYLALFLSCVCMSGAYWIYLQVLSRQGIQL